MHATLWQGTGETSAFRRTILKAVFAEADIPLDVVTTQEDLLAAAVQSRRAGNHDFLVIDCYYGEPSDVDRCVAVATRTRLAVHIIHPREETFHDIERIVGRPLVWVPATFSTDVLLGTLHALKAQVAAAASVATADRPPLTPREREVLGVMDQGLDNHAIAGKLHISLDTVKSHVGSITHKLGLTRAQIIAGFAGFRDKDERG